jgi:hypothetical protein
MDDKTQRTLALEANHIQMKTFSKPIYPFTLQSATQTNKISYIAQTMYAHIQNVKVNGELQA